MDGVALSVRIACNIIARELIKFLGSHSYNTGEGFLSMVSSWYRDRKDISALIPADFNIKGGIKAKIAISVLKKMPERHNGRVPAYDLVLQDIYDAAGYAITELVSSGDNKTAAKMREVQLVAAFLGNDKVMPWYYENMDKLHARIMDKIGDGRIGSQEIVLPKNTK